MRQRDVDRWRRTDGERGRRIEMEGGQIELCSQTFDSSWEEYLWETLFLNDVCLDMCVLTVLLHYMVNPSIANINSIFVYITLRGVFHTDTLF